MFCDVQKDERELRIVLRAETAEEHGALYQLWASLPMWVHGSLYGEKANMPIVTNVTIHFPRHGYGGLENEHTS